MSKVDKHFRQDPVYKHVEIRSVGHKKKGWGSRYILRCKFCNKFLSSHKVIESAGECYHCGQDLKYHN